MHRPLPILLMSWGLGIGGSERQLTEIAKSLDPGRFEVHVGCFHAGGVRASELRAAGIPILELPVTSFASLSAVRGARILRRYIREHGIVMVHSFDVPLDIFATPVAWLMSSPVVLTSQRAHRDLTSRNYRRLLRITDRMASGIVVNCEFMRRHLIEDEAVPPGKIQLCYNGIDLGIFRTEGERATHPNLEKTSVVIGTVCALRPEKGLNTLLAAFEPVARNDRRTRLVIVGSGPQNEALEEQAHSLDISGQCLFVPTTDRVAPWLRTMDIFVLPSLSEAFSNALMEAMACGCCVVASNVGGNPELAGDPSRGELFEASNPAALTGVLRELVADPGRRRLLASRAVEFIHAGFSVENSTARMDEIYTHYISRRG
jgi:glycosyltransferase involved in cell wall biosynthesis